MDVVFPLLRAHQNELTCTIKSVFDDDVCQLLYVISDLSWYVSEDTVSTASNELNGRMGNVKLQWLL